MIILLSLKKKLNNSYQWICYLAYIRYLASMFFISSIRVYNGDSKYISIIIENHTG